MKKLLVFILFVSILPNIGIASTFNIGGKELINLGEGTLSNSAATVGQVPGLIQGIIDPNSRYFGVIKGKLDAGQPVTIQIITDSTGDATNEWPYLLADWIATNYTNHNVYYKHMVGFGAASPYGTGMYTNVYQVGDTGLDDWHGVFGAGGSDRMYLPSLNFTTNQIHIEACVSFDNMTNATYEIIAAEWGTAGNRGWYLGKTSADLLALVFYDDGTTTRTAVSWDYSSTLSDNQKFWVKATYNGSVTTNSSQGMMYYRLAETNDWTAVATNDIAASFPIFNSTEEVTVGHARLATDTWPMTGKVYDIRIRDGLGGGDMVPRRLDQWAGLTTAYNGIGPTNAAPAVIVYNLGEAGLRSYYLDDAGDMDNFLQFGCDAYLVSLGHNENTGITELYNAQLYYDLLDNVASNIGTTENIIYTIQNQSLAPADEWRWNWRNTMAQQLIGYCIRNNRGYINVYRAVDTAYVGDGTHPGSNGQIQWVDKVTSLIENAP